MEESDFFSVDRLVEFGLSLAISQQMVASMNQTMKSTYIPGAMNPMHSSPYPELFYFVIDGKSSGPFSGKEILDLLQESKINKDTLAWKPGQSTWRRIEEFPEVLKLIALCPPEIPK